MSFLGAKPPISNETFFNIEKNLKRGISDETNKI